MTQARRAFLSELMSLAWSLSRADPARTFADALAGAWRWAKACPTRQAENARWLRQHKGGVAYGSMVQSPVRRSLTGPYREARARAAGYVTSMIGG